MTQRNATRNDKRRDPTTARQAYTERHANIQRQVTALNEALREHSDRAASKPRDWGFAGDLGHVEDVLGQILETFNAA